MAQQALTTLYKLLSKANSLKMDLNVREMLGKNSYED